MRDRGTVSRIEIPEATGLRWAENTEIARNLIDAGLFREILANSSLIENYRRHAAVAHGGEDITISFVAEQTRLGDHVPRQIITEWVSASTKVEHFFHV